MDQPMTYLRPFTDFPNSFTFFIITLLTMRRLLTFVTKSIIDFSIIRYLTNHFPSLHRYKKKSYKDFNLTIFYYTKMYIN